MILPDIFRNGSIEIANRVSDPKSYGDQEKFGVSFVIGQRVSECSKPLHTKCLVHVIPRGYDTPDRSSLLGFYLVRKTGIAPWNWPSWPVSK